MTRKKETELLPEEGEGEGGVPPNLRVGEIPWNVAIINEAKRLNPTLQKKTPREYIESHKGPGGKWLDYTPWPYAARCMTDAVGPTWSFTVVGEPKIFDLPSLPAAGHRDCNPARCTNKKHTDPRPQQEVVIHMRLTHPLCPEGQEGFGSSKFFPDNPEASFGDAFQSAQSVALRRIVARLGPGLDLYEKGDKMGRDTIENASEAAQTKALWRKVVREAGLTEALAVGLVSKSITGDPEALGTVTDCLDATGLEGAAAYLDLIARLQQEVIQSLASEKRLLEAPIG